MLPGCAPTAASAGEGRDRGRRSATPYLRAAARAAAATRIGLSIGAGAGLARLRVPGARRLHARAGERAARRLDRLGGAYLKAAQVLSTRADLLSDAQRAPLARLCDHVTPTPPARSLAARGSDDGLVDVDLRPFAAGSVTDVHLGRRRDTCERVAVKVLRPDVRARFAADLALMRGVTRLGARLPLLRSVPAIAAVELLADAVGSHLDLRTEAARQARLADEIGATEAVVVPRPHLDLCLPDVLVMDYVADALRIDDPRLSAELQHAAALRALHALYAMLFRGGLVHCDLHPGNLLVTSEGDLVIIDFGYACELDAAQQTAFAELFRAMATADGEAVAAVIVGTATRLPDELDHDALVADFRALVAEVSGSTAEDFNVARFVTALFAIQRRRGIVASPGFTMGIVALMTLEGLLKQLTPSLDFQREALPYVLERLERSRAARRAAARA
jgi:ubiquinone biosynthesis protein